MRKFKFFAVAVVALCIVACGSKKEEDTNSVTLQVEAELGDLNEFVSLNDKQVTVKLSDEMDDTTAIKVISSALALTVNKDVASDYRFKLNVSVLDKDHVEIAKLPYFYLESKYIFGSTEYEYHLKTGATHAQMRQEDKARNWSEDDQQMWDNIRENGVYILIKVDSDSKFVPYTASMDEVDEDTIDIDTLDF